MYTVFFNEPLVFKKTEENKLIKQIDKVYYSDNVETKIIYDISYSYKNGLIQEIELDPDVALDLLDVLDDDVENMDAEQVKITDRGLSSTI